MKDSRGWTCIHHYIHGLEEPEVEADSYAWFEGICSKADMKDKNSFYSQLFVGDSSGSTPLMHMCRVYKEYVNKNPEEVAIRTKILNPSFFPLKIQRARDEV
uniref:Uncharacterized protein n=2 Tax=Lotharella globosa TaxID=91324 RepID=A0A7S3YIP2_9EUKA